MNGIGLYGRVAQLGERLHGMQEVSGSIPLGSTIPAHRKSHQIIAALTGREMAEPSGQAPRALAT